MFRRPDGVPPGPSGLPLLGSALQLAGNTPLVMQKLAAKYGGVVGVYSGSTLVVFLNDYESIKEAFVKCGDFFSGRPLLFLFRLVLERITGNADDLHGKHIRSCRHFKAFDANSHLAISEV